MTLAKMFVRTGMPPGMPTLQLILRSTGMISACDELRSTATASAANVARVKPRQSKIVQKRLALFIRRPMSKRDANRPATS